jgi:hypothetical protein
MNPEFLRNLWLEAAPSRLALIAGLVLLVFAAAGAAPAGLASVHGAALTLYIFFAVLWGTRSAALSVVGEIRERTWDGQKLSSIGPAEMVWGKLFGATFANWFGAAICLPFILAPVWIASGPYACFLYALVLLLAAVMAQAVALLASLNLIRRNTGNWRLDTFLCQVAGIGAAFSYYTLWSSLPAFERSGGQVLQWWGHDLVLRDFHLVSLLAFTAWALVGCYRAMRAELRFANGPFVWLAWLAYLALYQAGFESLLAAHLPPEGNLLTSHGAVGRLALAGIAVLVSTYGMAFLEPKDPVRLRWLGEQVRAGHFAKAFLALDAWMLSYTVTLGIGLVLAGLLIGDNAVLHETPLSALALPILAMLGFLTRDVAIFVLMRGISRAKGDFAALAILAALYLLLPMILAGAGLKGLTVLLVPGLTNLSALGVLSAWVQGVGVAFWAASRIVLRVR